MTENYRILIVGNDPELAPMISDALEKDRYQLFAVTTLSESDDPPALTRKDTCSRSGRRRMYRSL